MRPELSALFAERLVDLGDTDARFAHILTPESAVGAAKRGVTAQFLDNAAQYHAAYTNHQHFSALIGNALASIDPPIVPRVILDIGSGSGNSVFPLLERFPDAFIVATDISPQLLAILRDELQARGHDDRVALVCMDASTNPYRSGVFDLAVGAAVLHHVIEPERVIRACEQALRPRAAAIFFEPFEPGQGVLNLAYDEILREAARRGEDSPGFAVLRQMHEDHGKRIEPGDRIADMDDKWMFTRAYFETLMHAGDWSECRIMPIHGNASPLVDQTRTNLNLAGAAAGSDLPPWAWAVLERYERSFTSHGRRDLPLEAAVVLRRGEFVVGRGGGESGWWWNPAEAGRGFFIDVREDALRIAACMYDDAGDPVWYAAGPAPLGREMVLPTSSQANVARAAPSTMRWRFDDDSRARIDWGDAPVPLQPQHAEVAGFHSPAWANMTGWWTEESDAPHCTAIVENLDTCVVAALLMRDEWCITVAERCGVRDYAGRWLRFSGGQTLRSSYRAPAAPQVLGPSRIVWPDMESLLLTRPDGRRCLMRRSAT